MLKKVVYSVTGVIILLVVLVIIGFNNPQSTQQTENTLSTDNVVADATSSIKITSSGNNIEKTFQTNKLATTTKKFGIVSLYPNPTLTPGDVLSVDVSKICVSGYTSIVRDVPLSVKKQVYAEYGVSYPQPTGAYEVDHFIPLEIGGSNDIKNLWLEAASPTPGFHQKDQYENYSHAQVCSGAITIQEAQRRMATDWYKYWIEETGGTPVSNTQATSTEAIPTTSTSSSTSEPQVKKSATGICHEKGSTYYDRTTNFTPYNSLNDCLASGGRLPRQ